MYNRIRYLKDEISFRAAHDLTQIKPFVLKCFKGKKVTYFDVKETYVTVMRIRRPESTKSKTVTIRELLNMYDKVLFITESECKDYSDRGGYKKIAKEVWHTMNDSVSIKRLFDMMLLNSRSNREMGYYIYDKFTKTLLVAHPEGALGLDDVPELTMRVINLLKKHGKTHMSSEVFRACDFGTAISEHRYCFFGNVQTPDISAIIAIHDYYNTSLLYQTLDGDNYHKELEKCKFEINPENGELKFVSPILSTTN